MLLDLLAQIKVPDANIIPDPIYRWIIGTLIASIFFIVGALGFLGRYILNLHRIHKSDIVNIMTEHKQEILSNSIKMTEATRDVANSNRELSESIKSIKDPIYSLVQNALKS